MKKLLSVLAVLVYSLFLSTPVFAQTEDERILEFKSDITVNSDATIDIKEEIVFRPPAFTQRHGLEWQIPYIYSVSAFRRSTKLDINSVVYYPADNPDAKVNNEYSRTNENGWAILRIGDANKYIEGTHVYIIDYTLTYTGITYFEENDEVYLNIIGPGWNIPIENASATIHLPGEVLESICYTGGDGSTDQNCTIEKISNENIIVKPTVVLNPYEGYTFAVKLPKGSIEDTTREQILLGILSNSGILLPIPVGIFLFGFLKKKYKNKKLTVIPQYEPEKDMDSLLSGLLYSGKGEYKPKYITAVLIELATKGYLKIREYDKKKYEFIKREKDGSDLPTHLRTLFDGVFGGKEEVKVDKISNFFVTASKVNMEAYQSLKEKDIFSTNKTGKKTLYIILSSMAFVFGIASGAFFAAYAAIGTLIGILLSAALIFIFSLGIDTRSVNGNKRYHYLLGLKMYIDTAEKHRIEFHNDPKRYNEVFEKLLPYAMIFGLEKQWAKLFEDIYTKNPDWYDGTFTTFNAFYLVNSLNSFNNTVVKSVSPPSYSSGGGYRSGGWSSGGSGFGGGSSGGGGGGSGGGGW